MHRRWRLVCVVAWTIAVCCDSRRHYPNVHYHGTRDVSGTTTAPPVVKDMDKYVVVDAKTGIRYNPYSKHHPGRHVCSSHKNLNNQPSKTRQAYCKPTLRKYMVPCYDNPHLMCTASRVVYETFYKDVISTPNPNEVSFSCCPGWIQVTHRSHGCNKPVCSKPCLNGGKCVKPDVCSCPKGYSGSRCEIDHNQPICNRPCQNGGQCTSDDSCSCPKGYGGEQCEINLNKPNCSKGCHNGGTCVRHELCRCRRGFGGRSCELDTDECKELKPCDQICHNTFGSFVCECKEDFILQADGQSCRKEDNDTPLEAKDLEFELLDKRIVKLETMMSENHKNEISKTDIQNIHKDMDLMLDDVHALKEKFSDMAFYKNDMYEFKNKLNEIEKKANKVDDLVQKYDRIKKCAFYNKICI